MKELFCFLTSAAFSVMLSASEIIIVSDSTAVDYRGRKNPYNRNKVGWEPMSGWGEYAAAAAEKNVRIINRSAGGFSSKTYWEKQMVFTRRYFKKGSWLLLSFGSNDARYNPKAPERNTTADGTFPEYLGKIADEARSAGMNVVIISPPPYYNMQDGKFSNPVLQPYARASEKLAKDKNYAYVDLFGGFMQAFAAMDDKAVQEHYMFIAPGISPHWPRGRKDPLHFTAKGAKLAWDIILNAIRKDIPELAKLFK